MIELEGTVCCTGWWQGEVPSVRMQRALAGPVGHCPPECFQHVSWHAVQQQPCDLHASEKSFSFCWDVSIRVKVLVVYQKTLPRAVLPVSMR